MVTSGLFLAGQLKVCYDLIQPTPQVFREKAQARPDQD
jgi:hypothetical protein